jgi:hypothetical protein
MLPDASGCGYALPTGTSLTLRSLIPTASPTHRNRQYPMGGFSLSTRTQLIRAAAAIYSVMPQKAAGRGRAYPAMMGGK